MILQYHNYILELVPVPVKNNNRNDDLYCLILMYMDVLKFRALFKNVTGFGKTCIVHTSDFPHSKIHKIR